MKKRYFVGVDGGGTKTRLQLEDEAGNSLSEKQIFFKTGEDSTLKITPSDFFIQENNAGNLQRQLFAHERIDRPHRDAQHKPHMKRWLYYKIQNIPEITC